MLSIYEQTRKTKQTAHEPRTYHTFHGLTKSQTSNEPPPIERFLGTAYKKHGRGLWKSTRIIGITLFHTLREGPQVLNIAQLSRDTGYSRPTVYRALAYFSRFGKVQRINERRTGKRRPCEYKLHPSFTEKQETAKAQEKGRCGVSVNLQRRESKEIQPTKGLCPSFSIDSFKNTPENQQLNQADKRRLSFLARRSCQSEAVSGVLDCLWQRDCCAGVWLDAIRGLQGVMIEAPPAEMVWRSRKAVAGLIGGLNEDGFKAIMLDQPANEQEAAERDVATLDRRLRGLEKWGNFHAKTMTSWFCEKRSELTRQRYETGRRLPGAICTDGFFKTIEEPQPRQVRAKRFKLTGFYTATRAPLSGEALRRKKAVAAKALSKL